MNLGCINAEHKSRIYCDAKFSFFIFKKKQRKKGAFSLDPIFIFTTQLHTWPEIISPLYPPNIKTNAGAESRILPSHCYTVSLGSCS